MKKFIILLLSITFSYAVEIPSNHLVDTSWLEKNLSNEKLVLIDTRSKEQYKDSHIKGAINYPMKMWFQGKIGNIEKTLNTKEQVQEMLSFAGVKEDSIVVFYSQGKDNTDFADSASALFTFWVYGFKNSVILNGGFNKWQYENKETTSVVIKKAPSDFEIESYDKSVIASLDDILEAQLNDEIQIADARVSKFYLGEIGREDLLRKGRIPTAKLTPMIRYTKKENNYYKLLSKEKSSKILNNDDFGLDLNSGAIFYCNTGHKAMGLWFVSKFIIGMEDAKVYSNSMVEYTRTNHPIEVGEPF